MKCLTVYEWKLLLEKRKIVFHVDSESEIALTVTLERIECSASCVGAREFWRNRERESLAGGWGEPCCCCCCLQDLQFSAESTLNSSRCYYRRTNTARSRIAAVKLAEIEERSSHLPHRPAFFIKKSLASLMFDNHSHRLFSFIFRRRRGTGRHGGSLGSERDMRRYNYFFTLHDSSQIKGSFLVLSRDRLELLVLMSLGYQQ